MGEMSPPVIRNRSNTIAEYHHNPAQQPMLRNVAIFASDSIASTPSQQTPDEQGKTVLKSCPLERCGLEATKYITAKTISNSTNKRKRPRSCRIVSMELSISVHESQNHPLREVCLSTPELTGTWRLSQFAHDISSITQTELDASDEMNDRFFL